MFLQKEELRPAPPLPLPELPELPEPELPDPEPDPLEAPPEDGALEPEPDEDPDEPEGAELELEAPPDGVPLDTAPAFPVEVELVVVDVFLAVVVVVGLAPPIGTVRPVAGFVPVPADPPPPQAASSAAVSRAATRIATFRAAWA